MKTLARVLIFLAAILFWLVVLVALNGAYLNIDQLSIIGASFVLSLATTAGVAMALRT